MWIQISRPTASVCGKVPVVAYWWNIYMVCIMHWFHILFHFNYFLIYHKNCHLNKWEEWIRSNCVMNLPMIQEHRVLSLRVTRGRERPTLPLQPVVSRLFHHRSSVSYQSSSLLQHKDFSTPHRGGTSSLSPAERCWFQGRSTFGGFQSMSPSSFLSWCFSSHHNGRTEFHSSLLLMKWKSIYLPLSCLSW